MTTTARHVWRQTARGLRMVLAVALSLAITLVFFVLLPRLQDVGRPPEKLEIRAVNGVYQPPPPPAPEEQTPEPPKPAEEPPPAPELTDNAPPLALDQLEIALGGVAGDGAGGDFGARLPGMGGAGGVRDQEAEEVFTLADLDQPPKPVHQPPPEYPPDLRRRGVAGSVAVIFLVDRDGKVDKPKVQASSHPAFEQPALQSVRKWRFEPGLRAGKPVAFRMRVPIAFRCG